LLSFTIVLALILTALAIQGTKTLDQAGQFKAATFNVSSNQGMVCQISYNRNSTPMRVDFYDPDGNKDQYWIPSGVGYAVHNVGTLSGYWDIYIVNEALEEPTTITYNVYVM